MPVLPNPLTFMSTPWSSLLCSPRVHLVVLSSRVDTTRQLYFDSGGQRCCCVLDRSLRDVQVVVLSPRVDWLNRFASP